MMLSRLERRRAAICGWMMRRDERGDVAGANRRQPGFERVQRLIERAQAEAATWDRPSGVYLVFPKLAAEGSEP